MSFFHSPTLSHAHTNALHTIIFLCYSLAHSHIPFLSPFFPLFPPQSRGRIQRDQRVAARLAQLRTDFTRLSAFYADADGSRRAAIYRLARADTLQPFLARARELIESHATGSKSSEIAMMSATQDGALSAAAFAAAAAVTADTEEAAAAAAGAGAAVAPAPALPSELAFTAGEVGGLMLDLTHVHAMFMELPLVRARINAAAAATAAAAAGAGSGAVSVAAAASSIAATIDNFQFLTLIDTLPTAIPAATKLSPPPAGAAAYEAFLLALVAALGGYHARWRPLAPAPVELEKSVAEEFELLWAQKALQGWFADSEAVEEGAMSVGVPARGFETSSAVLRLLQGGATHAAAADAAGDGGSSSSSSSNGHAMSDDADDKPASVPLSGVSADSIDNNPLFCKACDRLFPKQTVFDSHLTGKKHAKAAAKLAADAAAAPTPAAATAATSSSPSETTSSSSSKPTSTAAAASASSNGSGKSAWARRVALLELKAVTWCGLLRPLLDATLTYLDNRRTATPEELATAAAAAAGAGAGAGAGVESEAAAAAAAAAELASAAVLGVGDGLTLADPAAASAAAAAAAAGGGAGGDDDDDDEAAYNPLNLPLDWDGNPIPFWLYKLHQLNLRFACEICGGEEYRGTRNFYKHFREWKHTYFLKCLGIPNSEHFVNVPLIADAQALHARLQREAAGAAFSAAEGEEVEDALGNVYSKGVYDELKSKGLVN